MPGRLLRAKRGVDRRFATGDARPSTGAQTQGAGTRNHRVRAYWFVVMRYLNAELYL
jgi:hypothetical protein